MATSMTADQRRAFLLAGTRTGVLSTVRADGRPHAAPVWFILDGDDIVFNTGARTVKGRNLARDPRAVLTVDDPAPPFAFVTIEGRVELSEDPAELLDSATRIARRYMGAAAAAEYGARNGVPGEYVVRLVPDRIVAVAGLTD